jgi:carbamoylphosphate synthase large subunit
METNTVSEEFKNGQKLGQVHELLRAAVVARVAYWEAIDRLEKVLTDGAGFSDQADKEIMDCITGLASSVRLKQGDDITVAPAQTVIDIVKENPIE